MSTFDPVRTALGAFGRTPSHVVGGGSFPRFTSHQSPNTSDVRSTLYEPQFWAWLNYIRAERRRTVSKLASLGEEEYIDRMIRDSIRDTFVRQPQSINDL